MPCLESADLLLSVACCAFICALTRHAHIKLATPRQIFDILLHLFAVGVHFGSLWAKGAYNCVGKVRFGPYGCSAGLAVAADKAGARPSHEACATALTMLTKSGMVCDSLVSSRTMRAHTSAAPPPCLAVRPESGMRPTLYAQTLICRSRQSVRLEVKA